MRRSSLRAKERRFEIRVQRVVPDRFRRFSKLGFKEIGGAIYEDIQAAEVARGIIEKSLDSRHAGEIGRERDRALPTFFNLADNFTSFAGRFAVMDRNVGPLV